MITAIVLAAGTSSRLKTAKQLLPYQGLPLIRHVVDSLLESKVDHIIVVLGAAAPDVSAVLEGLPIQIVVNENFAHGQSTSVKLGVQSIVGEPLPDGVLFALGDQPLVKKETINILIDHFTQHGGIIVPNYNQTQGNPVIFAQKFLSQFVSVSGDVGGKQVMDRFINEVCVVDVDDQGVIFDIDTWEDYEKLQEQADDGG